jgi:hypothetical protein
MAGKTHAQTNLSECVAFCHLHRIHNPWEKTFDCASWAAKIFSGQQALRVTGERYPNRGAIVHLPRRRKYGALQCRSDFMGLGHIRKTSRDVHHTGRWIFEAVRIS